MNRTDLERSKEKFYKHYGVTIHPSRFNEGFRFSFELTKNQNLQMHTWSIVSYYNIINDIVKLFHELGLKDSMLTFAVFSYLLWNGYFSKDKDYIYQMMSRTNLMGYFGTDIINGKGVCLNKASMLDEIFRRMNYESYMIINKVHKDIKIDYRPDINRKVKKHGELPMKILSFLLNPITNVTGNHACVLVKKGDVYYVYDPTNLCVYKLDEFLSATIIGGTGSIDIKPYSLFYLYGLDNDKIVKIVNSYENFESKKKPYDVNFIKNCFEHGIEICKDNESLLNDFYDSTAYERYKVLGMFKK